MRIGVVMPVLNGFEDAVIALSRIRTKHIWTPYIGRQWEENKAISSVWNKQSLRAFSEGCDYVLIINDDSWLYYKTLDKLVDYMKETGIILVSGTNSHKDELFTEVERGPAGLDFSCFLIREETFDTVGLFDENFFPAYAEDNDYHYRIKLLGLPSYGLSDALFYHKNDGSNTKARLVAEGKWQDQNYRNCIDYYTRKWGGKPHQERFKIPFNLGGEVTLKDWKIEN